MFDKFAGIRFGLFPVAGLVIWLFLPIGARADVDQRVEPNADIKELLRAEQAVKTTKTSDDSSSAFQDLAWARSTVGDYTGAIDAFRKAGFQAAPPSDPHEVDSTLQGYRPIPAIEAIVAEAKSRQIVILNEAHHLSRDRAFAQLLAPRLREIGFEYLACETFNDHAEDMRKRGYVIATDGYYTCEPLFADFVRQSLKLGYIPVAYEFEGPEKPNQSADEAMDERETGEAANLVERIFRKNPKARVFIYVGFSHLMKKTQIRPSDPEHPELWMAGRLKAATGIDPLTIDQAAMTDPANGSLRKAILERVFSQEPPNIGSVVLRRNSGPGYLVLGPYHDDADIQIFHRPTTIIQGRPDWLSMNGYREPFEIPSGLLPKTGRRLIQAFSVDETGFPIEIDQVLVSAGAEPPPVLMLPPAHVRFSFEECTRTSGAYFGQQRYGHGGRAVDGVRLPDVKSAKIGRTILVWTPQPPADNGPAERILLLAV